MVRFYCTSLAVGGWITPPVSGVSCIYTKTLDLYNTTHHFHRGTNYKNKYLIFDLVILQNGFHCTLQVGLEAAETIPEKGRLIFFAASINCAYLSSQTSHFRNPLLFVNLAFKVASCVIFCLFLALCLHCSHPISLYSLRHESFPV